MTDIILCLGLQLPCRFPFPHLHHSSGSRRQVDSLRIHVRFRIERDSRCPDGLLLEQPCAQAEGLPQVCGPDRLRPKHCGAQVKLEVAHHTAPRLEDLLYFLYCASIFKFRCNSFNNTISEFMQSPSWSQPQLDPIPFLYTPSTHRQQSLRDKSTASAQ